MERPGLLKTVSSVFVFLAAFFTVSSFFGGSLGGALFGVIASALVGLVVLAIYYLVPFGRIFSPQSVCNPGPHDVEPGRPVKLHLNVRKGSTVVGTLEEKNGDSFEFMILDEENWVKYRQGKGYEVERDGEGEGTYTISWKVLSRGPWFLALAAYGKQLTREVRVNLRNSRRP